jgi:HEPN domain-containing protein
MMAEDVGASWLTKLSPKEWISAGLGELARAEAAWARGDVRAGIAGCKRAAGMALNAALSVEPKESWGRTYIEHLDALAKDAGVPEAVRASCKAVLEAKAPTSALATLRTKSGDTKVVEAARDVIAHALWVVKKHEA